MRPVLTDAAGRGFMARRAIEVGEVVLRASVSAWAPSWPCDVSLLEDGEARVCRVDAGAGQSFVARDADEAAAWLAGEVQSLWLLAIRCALLSATAPPLWAAVLCLEHHASARPPRLQRLITDAATRLARALGLAAGVQLTADSLVVLLGALLTNAFGAMHAKDRMVDCMPEIGPPYRAAHRRGAQTTRTRLAVRQACATLASALGASTSVHPPMRSRSPPPCSTTRAAPT